MASRHVRPLIVVFTAAAVSAIGLALVPSATAAPIPAGDVAAGASLRSVCTVLGTPGNDRLVGTPGDDIICGKGGDDVLIGRGGDDVLNGGDGDDNLIGGPGDDELNSEPGDDSVGATGINDTNIIVQFGRGNQAKNGLVVSWGAGGDCTTAVTQGSLIIDPGKSADHTFAFEGAGWPWAHCTNSRASAHYNIKGSDGFSSDVWLVAQSEGLYDFRVGCSGMVKCSVNWTACRPPRWVRTKASRSLATACG